MHCCCDMSVSAFSLGGASAVEGGDHDAAVLFHVHAVQRKVFDYLTDYLASGSDDLVASRRTQNRQHAKGGDTQGMIE